MQFCVNFSRQQDPENGHACSVLRTQKAPSQSHSRKQSQQASLLPPHHLTYNLNDIKQFLTKGPKTGIQNCLDKLSSFCTSRMMKVNPKKTKVMVFRKRARKNVEFHFLIDSQIIDGVQEYTYLGTRMSLSGNFSVSREIFQCQCQVKFFSVT